MTHAAPDKPNRSRTAWPDVQEPPKWAPAVHDHELPPWVKRTLVGIVGGFLLFSIGLGCLAYYVWQDHEFVLGRGQFRDRQNEALQQLIEETNRRSVCDLLDGLPAGPLLDPVRDTYSCGPGVLVEDLGPEAQQQLQQFSTGAAPPEQAPMVRPAPDVILPAEPPQDDPAAVPVPQAPEPGTPAPAAASPVTPTPPAAPTPAPVPAPPPLIDLTPITDPVCTALGVCL